MTKLEAGQVWRLKGAASDTIGTEFVILLVRQMAWCEWTVAINGSGPLHAFELTVDWSSDRWELKHGS